jgi:hypothetical protein
MNEGEESDCTILPMNQPNNEGKAKYSPTAEVGEGRVRIKENAGEPHTSPTQSGRKSVSLGLSGVRRAAKERKKERFTAGRIGHNPHGERTS